MQRAQAAGQRSQVPVAGGEGRSMSFADLSHAPRQHAQEDNNLTGFERPGLGDSVGQEEPSA